MEFKKEKLATVSSGLTDDVIFPKVRFNVCSFFL